MKVIPIVSGGLDSAVLVAFLKDQGHEIPMCLGFDYNQKHVKELSAATDLMLDYFKLKFEVVIIEGLSDLMPGSSQTDPNTPVPEGHYTSESMKTTIVSNRNMIMLSIATGVAIAQGADAIAYAAHAGDHAIYPDCREEFVIALQEAIKVGTGRELRVLAPFLEWEKKHIVLRGDDLGVPLHLTWSCYKGGVNHCGKCGTCVERKEAFELAHVEDRTGYEA